MRSLFSILSILHLGLTIKSRKWWTLITFFGGFSEILGWVGRLAGHFNVTSLDFFLINQVCPTESGLGLRLNWLLQVCLAVAPTFYSASE